MSYSKRKAEPHVQGYLDADDMKALTRRINFLAQKADKNSWDRAELNALRNALTALDVWQSLADCRLDSVNETA